MHPQVTTNIAQMTKTRQRLVDLHVTLTGRMYAIFRQHGLIEKRREMADAQIRQRCMAHAFDRATRIELDVIVAQLRHLHEGISQLEIEIAALKERQHRERQFAVDIQKTPVPVRIIDPRRYGAPELKLASRRFMMLALAIAASIHFLAIGGYWLSVYLQPVEEKPRVVRITKYMELEPPPSLAEEDPGPADKEPNILGGTSSGHIDIFSALGEIVAIKDKNGTGLLLDDQTLQRLDRLLDQQTLPGGGGQGGGRGGNGRGSGGQTYDQVVLGDFKLEDQGGIDRMIAETRNVESVKLEKKGQVNIESAGKIRGSEAAMTRRTAESVMNVINSQQARMMYVYNKYLRGNAELGGKINIDLTIEADGSVSKVVIVESAFTDQDFNRELLSIFRRLRFETIPEGAITVNLPLVFNRNE